MRTLIACGVLLAGALAGPALAAPAAHSSSAAGSARREAGALVFDGVPELPKRIAERLFQYQNARGASFQDWAPSGKGLLIATRFGQTTQIHAVASPGADRRQLTFFDDAVGGARFDEARGDGGFVFSMDTGGGEFYQLHWFDRANGRPELLTDGRSRNEGLIVRPRGGAIAWTGTERNGKDFDVWAKDGQAPRRLVKELAGQWNVVDWTRDGTRLALQHYVSVNLATLHVLDLATGALTDVAVPPAGVEVAVGPAKFSADGKAVFFATDEGAEFQRLVRHDLATGKRTVLTAAIPWDVEAVELSADGRALAFTVNEGGRTALYLASSSAPTKHRKVTLPAGVASLGEFEPRGRRLALTIGRATGAADVYTVDPAGKLTQWTHSELGGLDPAGFVEPKVIEYPTFDQKKIPAWVTRAAQPGKRPVLIQIHGGPEAQAMARFNPFNQYLARELGITVIEPNVRGSAGYGKSYLKLDNADKRMDSVKDIGALLDWIATQPDLDASRVAVYGGSYGGFMVLASLVEYGPRLRCGVDIVGISHFVTFLTNTEDYRRDLRRVEYGDERDPKMRALLEKISPLTNAKKITRPLFVIQGLNDPRVPATEAEQIVKTVRQSKGAVWYLLAKDEGHGFRKKSNRDAMTTAVALFLEEHLLR